MGRKTWASLPIRFRPLAGRLNVVLSRNPVTARRENSIPLQVPVLSSLDEAIEALGRETDIETIYIIGGESLYKEAVTKGLEQVVATVVHSDVECDAFFPVLPESFRELVTPPSSPSADASSPVGATGSSIEEGVKFEENGIKYQFVTFVRDAQDCEPQQETTEQEVEARNIESAMSSPTSERHEEYQYLDLIREVITNGVDRDDRTGTGTRSVFGRTMRFSLRDGTLPLLTTKRVFWRGVAEELLWFVSGSTNAKELQDKNIHIWDGNGSREYLDKIGLTEREEMDLGPVYGFQWRHFGAEYKTMHDDYTGQGVDQLAELVHKIKANPGDRRLIVSAWNPAAFRLMALPPCHMFAQFYVANGELSCQMYQRSADMGLGVPFNIASYALLTHMLAKCTGLKAGEFVHVIGDCHVYKNHIDPLKEQLERTPVSEFPKLKINTDNVDIDGFKYEDFEVVGYKPQKSIKMAMSV
jgi:dihydrofolate reductase/thymidylate synthase